MRQSTEEVAGRLDVFDEPPSRVRYMVLASLCLVSLITYVDRVGFAAGAPYLKEDLGLSDEQMGYLLSAFFWAYGGFQILGGWLGDRLGSRHLLTILVLGWSLTTGALALVVYVPSYQGRLAFLIALRFLFGVFQAGGFPVLSRINADWMPTSSRGMSQGLIWMSSRMGGALIPLALAPMFAAFGTWRTPFWILAGVGVVWAAAFWPWFRDTPEEMPRVNREERAVIAAGRGPGPRARPAFRGRGSCPQEARGVSAWRMGSAASPRTSTSDGCRPTFATIAGFRTRSPRC